jgi:hypothetical protein
MERRNFLRNLGGLFAVSLMSPSILKALDRSSGTESTLKIDEKTTVKSLSGSLDMLDAEQKEWTEAFFKYLKNNNVGFKWERVYSPIFETKVGRLYECRAHKVANFQTFWELNGVHEVHMQSFSGGTSTYYSPKTLEEYREKIFAEICMGVRNRKRERVYVYSIMLTPQIYDPMGGFQAIRGVCIKGVEI